MLDFSLTMRAPKDGMRLAVRSGKASLGEVKLTREFATYHFSLPRANLLREGNSFLIVLSTSAFADPDGRLLGVELRQAVLNNQPSDSSR